MSPIERIHFAMQNTDNPDCRVYHTRMVLTDFASQGVVKCEGVEILVDGILEFVISMPGVTQALVEPHRLTVTKSPLFDWEEIEPRIKDLFQFSKIPELLRYPAPWLPEQWLPKQVNASLEEVAE
jgi:hypothetical protein